MTIANVAPSGLTYPTAEYGLRIEDLESDVADLLAGDRSGWEDHVDTQYTSGSPFAYTGGTGWTTLPNNSGTVINTYAPAVLNGSAMFASNKFVGREGDGIFVTVEFSAVPGVGTDPLLEVAIDIGGAVGRIYARSIGFPKGAGVERLISYSHFAYTLDTWEANGGTPVFECNVDLDIYDVRCVVAMAHHVS